MEINDHATGSETHVVATDRVVTIHRKASSMQDTEAEEDAWQEAKGEEIDSGFMIVIGMQRMEMMT
jgi:hypothetical protein